MKIGVFDSGVGGESVANAIKEILPEHEVVLRQDRGNLPYGTKPPELLKQLVLPILKDMQSQGCSIIVIACNTVTTTIIGELRAAVDIPLIGIEPMVKPAAERTKSGIIAVCATPATLSSPRYAWLKQTYADGVQVLEPDCSDWAGLIESKKIDRRHIHDQIESVCGRGADVIVLGCTHYHWIKDIVQDVAADRALVLQPEDAVLKQLRRVIVQLV